MRKVPSSHRDAAELRGAPSNGILVVFWSNDKLVYAWGGRNGEEATVVLLSNKLLWKQLPYCRTVHVIGLL